MMGEDVFGRAEEPEPEASEIVALLGAPSVGDKIWFRIPSKKNGYVGLSKRIRGRVFKSLRPDGKVGVVREYQKTRVTHKNTNKGVMLLSSDTARTGYWVDVRMVERRIVPGAEVTA